jgi:hypothetical protein
LTVLKVLPRRAEDHEGRDNNNGNQNKDQRIFDQPLTAGQAITLTTFDRK